jgi:hypothetical protein
LLEIAGFDVAVIAGRTTSDAHTYLRDNWMHHREEWRKNQVNPVRLNGSAII